MRVDSGDTFVPLFSLNDDKQRKDVEATARFIVDHFNRTGHHAITLGDRDLLLGVKTLKALAKRAKFPFLAANLVHKATGKPVLQTTAVVTIAGYTIGLFGVLGSNARLPADSTMAVQPYLPAAKQAVSQLRAQQVDMVVALSHLSDAEHKTLARELPRITLILGGQTVKMQRNAEAEGQTFITTAFSKGKYVGLLRLNLHKGTTSPNLFVDRFRASGLDKKLVELTSRLKRYSAIVERNKSKPPPKPAVTRPGARKAPHSSARSSFYVKQITKLRADKQLLEMEIANAPKVDPAANFIRFELLALGKNITHEPEVEKAVVAFRKKVPSLSKKPAKRPPALAPGRQNRPGSAIGPVRTPLRRSPAPPKRP